MHILNPPPQRRAKGVGGGITRQTAPLRRERIFYGEPPLCGFDVTRLFALVINDRNDQRDKYGKD